MQKLVFLILVILSYSAVADTKLAVDVAIDKLTFKKPLRGIGKGGTLIFKTANVNNNGIVLNINNVSNNFDSQIFVRPTFLGFTTKFGNYGFSLEADSMINSLNQAEVQNSKLVLDDNQLNLSGQYFNFITPDLSVKLKTFRLYCQSIKNTSSSVIEASSPNGIMENCFNFLTFNGNYVPNNELASFEYEGIAKGEKKFIKASVKSFDIRKNKINASLISARLVNNDSYFVDATNVNLNCDKDEDLTTLDFNNIKTTCLNRLKIGPFKAKIVDKNSSSAFSLDVKYVIVKDRVVSLVLNEGSFAGMQSTTNVSNLILKCKKEVDTDLSNINMIIKDCVKFSNISIEEIKNTKPGQQDSSIKNITLNSVNGNFTMQAEIFFMGISAHFSISGHVAISESRNKLTINITDTQLPQGSNSVKGLMLFLSNNLISKDINIQL